MQASEKLSDLGVSSFSAATVVDRKTNEIFYDLNDDGEKSADEPSIKIEGKIDSDRIDPRQKIALAKVVSAESAKHLQELAKSLGMQYGETALISETELNELEGIGKAASLEAADANPFETNQTPVRNLVFGDESTYRPLRMENTETNNIYVGWKTVFVPLHVPEFDDEGIRDQVLTAWKLEKARALAQKRAEELAESVRVGGKSLVDTLADQKAAESSPEPLKVSATQQSFSWLTTTTVPGPNPLASEVRPEMSDVPFVKKPGEKFMKTIFEDLKPNEVGVTSDFDATHYYVVRVLDREPSEEALAEKRNEFFTGRLFGFSFGGMRFGATPYDYLSDVQSQQSVADWVNRLEKAYRVEFVDEDKLENNNG